MRFWKKYLLEIQLGLDKCLSFYFGFSYLHYEYSDKEDEAVFFWDQGQRFCIIAADGSFMRTAGSRAVCYRIDKKSGSVVSRERLIDRLDKGEKLIFGDKNIEKAYLSSPNQGEETVEIVPSLV